MVCQRYGAGEEEMKKNSATSERSRPGIYARGAETVVSILNAASQVLVEEGASSFTLRRIATRCGLQVGNVSKHFPRKEMLIETFLDDLLVPCRDYVDDSILNLDISAEEALGLVISGSIDCIALKYTTNLFIELWAMANHNQFVSDKIDEVYRYTRSLITELVEKLNPQLSAGEAYSVATYIHASIEGAIPILGYGKPCASRMPQIKAIAVRTLVNLAKNDHRRRTEYTSIRAPEQF